MKSFLRQHLFKLLIALILLEICYLLWNHNKNHRPEIVSDNAIVYSRQAIKIDPIVNDVDKDEDSLYIVNISEPQHGSIFIEDGYYYYKPEMDYIGNDNISYIISDGRKKSKPGKISIEIRENFGPKSLHDTIYVFAGGSTPLFVMQNDVDLEKDSVYFEDFSQPLFGKIEQRNSIFIYTPKKTFSGIDSFQYVLTDGFTKSEKANVMLVVNSGDFSKIPYYGNAVNYTFFNSQNWSIEKNGKNKSLAMNSPVAPVGSALIGECGVAKERTFGDNFLIKYRAKSVEIKNQNEHSIIFSYLNEHSYNIIRFIKDQRGGRIVLHSIKNDARMANINRRVKTFQDSNFHLYEIQKLSDSISIKFDGKFIFGVSNKDFKGDGAIGLATRRDQVHFDDINILSN